MVATTNQGKIAELLLARVGTLVMASPTWPVAYPRRPFTPPDNAPYLRVDLISNATASRGLPHSSRNQLQGILQVTLCLPAGDSSAVQDGDQTQLVIDHFKRGTALAGGGIKVSVNEQPSKGPDFTEADKTRIPISIPWVAFVAA